jgi:flagellar motility protein MotE (MotC chaperone)
MMKILTNPIVLIVVAVLFFIIGFGGGLWKIGYFNPATYASVKKEKAVKEIKAKTAAETQEKVEIEWLQKLAIDFDRSAKDLTDQKQKLNEEEVELQKKKEELKLEKQAVEKIKKDIQDMKTEFDSQLALVESNQEGNIQRLAKLYTVMDVANAAKMISGMTDVQAVQVLRSMKDAKSAKILELWIGQPDTVDKAKRVSELIRLNQPAPVETTGNTP